MTVTPDTHVSDIVADDFRAAAVFERLGIDFCCGGRRSLREACGERHVNLLDVLAEITEACERQSADTPHFADWPPDVLIAYIVSRHHTYVRRVLPAIVAHTCKVAAAHGASRPELSQVEAIFAEVADEMTSHMAKEEGVLFPYINRLAIAGRLGEPVPAAPFGSVDRPIAMMEDEHENAGRAMARIRELTRNYSLPTGACTTYVTCFRELDEFERDLHVHVHLENNVLFPKARELAASASVA
jgi:regulator of cell morphogenesis and NO signaling